MPTVLLVCTGNLCRSPMAAALLRARLERDPAQRDWKVYSAGTWAAEGRPASTLAIEVMAQHGINLCAHRSRSVTRGMMEEADLVLPMTQNHAEALEAAFPDQAQRVHLLSEMAGHRYDIADPYGGARTEYAHTAEELERLIEGGYERIVTLVESAAEHRR